MCSGVSTSTTVSTGSVTGAVSAEGDGDHDPHHVQAQEHQGEDADEAPERPLPTQRRAQIVRLAGMAELADRPAVADQEEGGDEVKDAEQDICQSDGDGGR